MKRIFEILMRIAAIGAFLTACQQQDQPAHLVSAQPKKWFSPTSSFDECFETSGPAGRIVELTGERPGVTESNGGRKVTVHVYRGSKQIIWTYYRDKSICEDEQVNVEKRLADKYR